MPSASRLTTGTVSIPKYRHIRNEAIMPLVAAWLPQRSDRRGMMRTFIEGDSPQPVAGLECFVTSAQILLWDDNPSTLDLLGFDAIVQPVVAALEQPDLDPLTISVQSPWGGGKSTILELLNFRLKDQTRYIVIRTNPWEYDDHDDVRGTLITEVLRRHRGQRQRQRGAEIQGQAEDHRPRPTDQLGTSRACSRQGRDHHAVELRRDDQGVHPQGRRFA